MNPFDINIDQNSDQENKIKNVQKELEVKFKEINILKMELHKRDKVLEEKEKNLILAAQYGKELLEKNAMLHNSVQDYNNKNENLQQDKHSLSMKLEGNEKIIKTLTSELEIQEKFQNENHKKLYDKLKDENVKLKRNVSCLENKNESAEKELMIHKEKIDDLEQMLEMVQKQQLETSQFNSTQSDLEEYTNLLQHQINSLTINKQDLEKEMLNLKSMLKKSAVTIQSNENMEVKLQSELEEKECQLTSKYNEVERLKTEIEELKMEIDHMKLKETDPNKKGNSLFAELEDNRQLLEKQVTILNSKFANAKSLCAVKSEEVNKLKLHIATLLGMNSNTEDMNYQKHLEEVVEVARNQVKSYADKCKELEEQLKGKKMSICDCKNRDKHENENFMKYLLEESQTKMSALEEEVRKLLFKKISVDDQNLQLKRKLHQSEREKDIIKSEIIRLNVKIDELKALKSISAEYNDDQELAFHYEEVPRSKGKKEEKLGEKRSNRILQEKFIQAENYEEFPESFKEEEPPSKVIKKEEIKKLKKEVKFSEEKISEANEVEKRSNRKDPVPKIRRKMEAPHIIADGTETSECKTQ